MSEAYKKKNPHKHSVFTVPDEHMPYIIQLHIMSIQPSNKAARAREREGGTVMHTPVPTALLRLVG